MELYKKIKARRQSLGWSQQELAERCGYTDRSSIAKIEAGKIDLSQTKILTFAEALGVSVSELMGTVEAVKPSDIEKIAGRLNEKGVNELIAYAQYLISREEYRK